jgi:hypothetical protein
MDIFEHLETECKRHDWWYMMSDDHRVYCAGRDNYAKLQAIYVKAKEVDALKALEIWEKYSK